MARCSRVIRYRGVRGRRLGHLIIRKPQHDSKNVADAVSIVIAEAAGLDARKQCHAFVSVQVEGKKVYEKLEPLKHRGGHRCLERTPRLRFGV